jgi:hypothetical protein
MLEMRTLAGRTRLMSPDPPMAFRATHICGTQAQGILDAERLPSGADSDFANVFRASFHCGS